MATTYQATTVTGTKKVRITVKKFQQVLDRVEKWRWSGITHVEVGGYSYETQSNSLALTNAILRDAELL